MLRHYPTRMFVLVRTSTTETVDRGVLLIFQPEQFRILGELGGDRQDSIVSETVAVPI